MLTLSERGEPRNQCSVSSRRQARRIGSLRRLSAAWILLLFAVWASGAVTNAAQLPAATRLAEWAVRLERPGLPNLFQVSPVLYRGAQPKKEGIPALEGMGIRTVVSLRGFVYDGMFPNLVGYLRNVDIASIKQEAGLSP